MSKPPNGFKPVLAGLLVAGTVYLFSLPVLMAQSVPAPSDASATSTVADAQVARAKSDLERTERLVADGTLPRAKVDEARAKLADAEDEALLKRTLYGLRL